MIWRIDDGICTMSLSKGAVGSSGINLGPNLSMATNVVMDSEANGSDSNCTINGQTVNCSLPFDLGGCLHYTVHHEQTPPWAHGHTSRSFCSCFGFISLISFESLSPIAAKIACAVVSPAHRCHVMHSNVFEMPIDGFVPAYGSAYVCVCIHLRAHVPACVSPVLGDPVRGWGSRRPSFSCACGPLAMHPCLTARAGTAHLVTSYQVLLHCISPHLTASQCCPKKISEKF